MDLKSQFIFTDEHKNVLNDSNYEFIKNIEIKLITDPQKYDNVFDEIYFHIDINVSSLKYPITFKYNENTKFNQLPKELNSLKIVSGLVVRDKKQNIVCLILFYSIYFFKEKLRKTNYGFSLLDNLNNIKKIYTEVYIFDSEFDTIQNTIYPSIDIINQMNFICEFSNILQLIHYDVINETGEYRYDSGLNDVMPYNPYKHLLSIF